MRALLAQLPAARPGQRHAARRIDPGCLAALARGCGPTGAGPPRRPAAAAPPGLAEPLTDASWRCCGCSPRASSTSESPRPGSARHAQKARDPRPGQARRRRPHRGRGTGTGSWASSPDTAPQPAPVTPSGDRSPRSDIPPGRHLWVTPHAGGNPYRSPRSRANWAGLTAIGHPEWMADRGDEKQCSGSVSTGRGPGASAPGRRHCRPTHGTPMWSGPRRLPVPVTAPAEVQPGSHLPPSPPGRPTDGEAG